MVHSRSVEDEYDDHLGQCMDDPTYFMQAHLKVRAEKAGDPVHWGPMLSTQQEIQGAIDTCRVERRPCRLWILKARRHRASTLIGGNGMHRMLFTPGFEGLVAAHETGAAQELLGMYDTFYWGLPDWLRPTLGESNANTITFDNTNPRTRKSQPGLGSSMTVAVAAGTGRRAGADLQRAAGMGRARRFNFVHFSELAYYPNAETSVNAIMQAVPMDPDTLVVKETTANGQSGYAYEDWLKTVAGETGFTPLFLAWYRHDHYTADFLAQTERAWACAPDELRVFADYRNALTCGEMRTADGLARRLGLTKEEEVLILVHKLEWTRIKWRRWAIAVLCGGNVADFHEAFPSTPEEAFISTGTPRFDVRKIAVLKTQQVRETEEGWLTVVRPAPWDARTMLHLEPLVRWTAGVEGHPGPLAPEEDPWLDLYMPPHPDKKYIIVSDTAHGYGGGADASSALVYNMDDARFDALAVSNRVKPDRLAEWLAILGWWYNRAEIVVEVNESGLAVVRKLVNGGYPNVYRRRRYDKATADYTDEFGWMTNEQTRSLLIDTFDASLAQDRFFCPFPILFRQAEQFTRFPPRTEFGKERCDHPRGHHDDVLMAAMIACLLATDATFGRVEGHPEAAKTAEEQARERMDSWFKNMHRNPWAVDTPAAPDVELQRHLELFY